MSAEKHSERTPDSVYHVESSDPDSILIDRSQLSAQEIEQINRLMRALGGLRRAEDELSEASTKYMKLNKTDMRALHFLIVSGNRGELATPSAIAAHLGISTASTTKLLDRLARAGHVTREPHPSDRRALVIRITQRTHLAAMETVGRQHAKRFEVAARMTAAEREVVIRFVEEMASELSVGPESWPVEDSGEHA